MNYSITIQIHKLRNNWVYNFLNITFYCREAKTTHQCITSENILKIVHLHLSVNKNATCSACCIWIWKQRQMNFFFRNISLKIKFYRKSNWDEISTSETLSQVLSWMDSSTCNQRGTPQSEELRHSLCFFMKYFIKSCTFITEPDCLQP